MNFDINQLVHKITDGILTGVGIIIAVALVREVPAGDDLSLIDKQSMSFNGW